METSLLYSNLGGYKDDIGILASCGFFVLVWGSVAMADIWAGFHRHWESGAAKLIEGSEEAAECN